jgi:hypothetical protein
MQFLVPKFIDRETTLVGPLTFKQLLWLVGVGVFVFVLYFFLPRNVFWVIVVITVITSAAFVLIKPGGRPLSSLLQHLGGFIFSPKRYIWQKRADDPRIQLAIKREKDPLIEEKKKKLLGVSVASQLSHLETKIGTKRI